MEPKLDGGVIENKNESNQAFGFKVMVIYVTGLINWHDVYIQHSLMLIW